MNHACCQSKPPSTRIEVTISIFNSVPYFAFVLGSDVRRSFYLSNAEPREKGIKRRQPTPRIVTPTFLQPSSVLIQCIPYEPSSSLPSSPSQAFPPSRLNPPSHPAVTARSKRPTRAESRTRSVRITSTAVPPSTAPVLELDRKTTNATPTASLEEARRVAMPTPSACPGSARTSNALNHLPRMMVMMMMTGSMTYLSDEIEE